MNAAQGSAFLRHWISRVDHALDEADVLDNFVFELLSASVHHLKHAP